MVFTQTKVTYGTVLRTFLIFPLGALVFVKIIKNYALYTNCTVYERSNKYLQGGVNINLSNTKYGSFLEISHFNVL